MKTRLAGILLLISLVICLAGCSQPIGTLYDKALDEASQRDGVFIIPRQIMYTIDEDTFNRLVDFQLFIVENGEVWEEKNLSKPGIEVALVFQPNLSTEMAFYTANFPVHYDKYKDRAGFQPSRFIETLRNFGQPLHRTGRGVVYVELTDTYIAGGRSGEYAIEVFSLNNGSGSGDGDGIGIIWLE